MRAENQAVEKQNRGVFTYRGGEQERGTRGLVPQPLRWIVSTVFERFAGSAMAALFGRKVTTLTAEELERLKELVEHAEPEDE